MKKSHAHPILNKVFHPSFVPGNCLRGFLLLFAIVLLWSTGTTRGTAQTFLLSNNTPTAFSLVPGSYGNGFIAAVTGQPFTSAWQVNVTATAPNPSGVTLTANTSVAVAAGDLIVASFSYRRTDSTADEININARFEQVASPFNASVVVPLRGRGQWRQVSIPFIANASYAAGSARFYFQLSAQKQKMQISGVTLANYGQTSLFGPGIIDASPSFAFNGTAAGTTYGTNTSVAVSGNPFFSTASHITVTANPNDDSTVQLKATVPSAVTANHNLLAIFWARDADTVPKNAVIGFSTQNAAGTKVVSYNQSAIIVDGAWKQHVIPFTIPTTYAANGMAFVLKCSAQLQTVEIGGLQLLDIGTVPATSLSSTLNDYPGRLITDSWRTAANTRINTYRKGNFTLNVTDGSGAAIASASVSAVMQKHLFGFGSAVQAQELTTVTGADADTYRATVKALFNKVVFENDMKWVQWEAAGQPAKVQNAVTWLRANGITNIRGHNLVWPAWGYCPTDLPGLSVPALTTRILMHIDSESQYFKIKNYMSDWDVVNEPYVNHSVMDKINGVADGTLAQDAAVIRTWYTQAAGDDTCPDCYLNDFGVVENPTRLNPVREDYNYNLLSTLLAYSPATPVDGFGFESHFTSPTPPLTVKTIFDRFAGLGLKGQVTEYDFATTDTALQADYLADYMTMAFSEPNFNSFLMWGFWDTKSWINNAPLYTSTWELKPSGEAWQGLVFGKWWTNTSAIANASGTATVNGFLGRYALTATNAGITKTYYADLPLTTGSKVNLKLSGSTGTTHVWLHAAARAVLYPPFAVTSDVNAYDGSCVTATVTNNANATSGVLRIDSEATGLVNIWLRVIAPDSASDAFWLTVDGSAWQNFTVTQGTSWHWVLWKQTTLGTGTHAITLANAEAGAQLDQVLITDDLAFTP